jgi:hypothetical protein
MPTVYNFEAKSIQTYILDSGKLKDMIGASEQIEYLCCDQGLLDQVLDSLDLSSKVQFARKAGGAFVAIFSEHQKAERFQAVWTFCVQKVCPGLDFAQGIGTGKDLKMAIENAAKAFKTDDHNRLLFLLPLAGPLVARNPRTGQPAVNERFDEEKQREERLDIVTDCKRQFRKGRLLIDKLALEHEGKLEYDWPTNLEFQEPEKSEITFPFLKDNQYLGIIHADGNDLGQLSKTVQDKLLENPDSYARIMKDFSEAIQDTTVKSARQATIDVLTKKVDKLTRIMPARPLVLGGDDLTFIVRGDLALDFTNVFLEEFEKRSQQALTQLKQNHNELEKILPEQLTACAGIAYIKASQPFYQGYDLAESLCKHAKTFSHEHSGEDELMPSSIAFHRITSSLIGDYKTILERELTVAHGNTKIQLTMQPYLVGDVEATANNHECVKLEDLQTLFNFLNESEISHGIVREFLSLLEIDYRQAVQTIQRWHDNLKKRGETELSHFEQLLGKLIEEADTDMDCPLKLINRQKQTPVSDALALIHVSKGSDYVSS